MGALVEQVSKLIDEAIELDQVSKADELIITRRGTAPQFMVLDKSSYVLGRDDENDITLDGQAVSRQHIRLERESDGWHIVDLGSTNGTYVGGMKLKPNESLVWQSGHPLQVGAYTLQWQSPQDVKGAQTLVLMPDEFEPLMQQMQEQPDETVNVVLDQPVITLSPGATGTINLGLLSSETQSKQLVIEVDGLPSAWVELADPTITLLPKKHLAVPINISVPTGGALQEAKRRFTITLRNTQQPQFSNMIVGTLNITAERIFDVMLSPTSVVNAGDVEMLIRNDGNVSAEYRISRESNSDGIRFKGDVWDVALMPATTMNLWYAVSAEKRPLVGSPRTLNYTLNVRDTEGDSHNINGEVVATPVIPKWALGAMAVLLTVIFVALLLR